MKTESLQPLVARLRACPTHETNLSRELFIECWDELHRDDITPLIKPTIPILAALVLHDDRFATLLNAAEHAQLLGLIKLALDRYEQQTQPPNKLGKLIAGILKETT